MKLKILILFIGVLLFNLSTVDARLGEFQQGECVDIKTILNTSLVNISTISYPNSSTAIANQVMDKNGSTFNFTFCQTNDIGVYNYDYFDSEGQTFVNDFLITPIGDSINTGQSLIYIILLISDLLLLALFGVIVIITPYENAGEQTNRGTMITRVTKTKYVKLVSILISYGLFLIFIMILTGMANNYLKFEALNQLMGRVYGFLSVIGYGLTVSIVWILFLNLWKDIILNKIILREGKAFLREL